MLLADYQDIRERTVCSGSDNTPTVARLQKGSTTSIKAPAHLNRLFALHKRQHRYLSLHSHIAGSANVMADDASRLWDMTDSQFLSYFEQTYPQTKPWTLVRLTPAMILPVISSLRSESSAAQLLPLAQPRHQTRGESGKPSVMNSTSSPASPAPPTPSPSSWFLLSVTGMERSPKRLKPISIKFASTEY